VRCQWYFKHSSKTPSVQRTYLWNCE
jgi:hypothetical protein